MRFKKPGFIIMYLHIQIIIIINRTAFIQNAVGV